MPHQNYSSIEQFKNVIKSVRDRSEKYGTPLPKLTFSGTCKAHGTNAGVRLDPNSSINFQSRERDLSITSDNAGFCMWGNRNIEQLKRSFDNIDHDPEQTVVIFGEWCGPGIQKSVAVSQLPHKMFLVFDITLINPDDSRIHLTPDQIKQTIIRTDDILTIYDFKTWEVEIDFNDPQAIQNHLVELTLEVERECPIGKHFGISGIGEGIVFVNREHNLKFKCKGEAHSATKVRTIKEIAVVDIERMKSIAEFVDRVVSENRLNQGIAKLGEKGLDVDVKNTGSFMQWVVQDAIKEEFDTIVASGFDMKEIGKAASDKAKQFWFNYLNSNK